MTKKTMSIYKREQNNMRYSNHTSAFIACATGLSYIAAKSHRSLGCGFALQFPHRFLRILGLHQTCPALVHTGYIVRLVFNLSNRC